MEVFLQQITYCININMITIQKNRAKSNGESNDMGLRHNNCSSTKTINCFLPFPIPRRDFPIGSFLLRVVVYAYRSAHIFLLIL